MSSLTKIVTSLAENPTEDYITLLQNIFRIDISNHCYRGYAILDNGKILEKSLNRCNEKTQLCLMYSQASQEWLNLFDTIERTPALSKSIERIQDFLLPKGIDVNQLWNQKQVLNLGNLVLATVALQIAITDMLKDILQERVVFAEGFCSGTIASAYAKNALALEEALELAFELRNQLDQQCKDSVNHILNELKNQHQETATKDSNVKLSTNMEKLVIGLAENRDLLSFGPTTTLSHILGRLYVLGFNLHLDKLYPDSSWPVKAPFISPLIQWQHEDDWHVLKYQPRNLHRAVVTINLDHKDWKFLAGHVVDGRILFPATAYLYIVWKSFLKFNHLLMSHTKVVFENVRFQRITVLNKQKPVTFTVDITKVQNDFEIKEGNDCLVTGKVRASSTDLNMHANFPSYHTVMHTKDIYKKLNLHGYHYKNLFCCLQEASLDCTIGSIKWNNWMTFLDAMQHFMILNKDLDDLYVPTRIDRLVIDPQAHAHALKNYKEILPVYYNLNSNTVEAPGVEFRNVILSIIKKRSKKCPVLGIHKFVPFHTELSLEDSVMVHVQLVIENFNNALKVAEVVDSFSDNNRQLLSPIIKKALDYEFGVDVDLSIYSTKIFNDLNVSVKQKTIEHLPSDINLVIISHGSQRSETIAQILQKHNCLILSRETGNFDRFQHVEVISVHRTNIESLVLLGKTFTMPQKIIQMKSDFVWLEKMQLALSEHETVLLVVENDPTSGVLGLVTCLRHEIGRNVCCVFLPDTVREFDVEDEFYQKQLRKGLLVNVFKDGTWGSYRHLPLGECQKECFHAFGVTTSGDLSSVQYIQGPLTKNPSGIDQVLIDIYYAGINFEDGLISSKQYRTNFESIGFEFAGKNSTGQRIMGFAPNGAFSNSILVSENLLCNIPQEWSMKDAATIPVAYLTVLYGLLKISELKRGQSILIHSGSGGVGQAAINVALHFNCNIFTTVGSAEERQYLKTVYPTIPDSHIGNSRDVTFEQMILKQTKGKGVDVIINSLSEDKLQASVRCLGRKGIFLEVGKHDLQLNNPLSMDTYTGGRTYTGIHLDMFFGTNATRQKQVMFLLQNGIKNEYVKPLPRVVYDRSELQEALQSMNLTKHTGKFLLKFKDESVDIHVPLRAKPRFFCDSNKVYVIIGGLGGFGMELADWLIGRGARKLILVSRSGVTTGYQNYKLKWWERVGCKVLLAQDDLTCIEGCIKLLTEANALGVVDGIFNLSLLLHNALIENQTEDTFKTVLKPKALITKNMDTVSKVFCPYLRNFVVFSSVVSSQGISGQTNYGMANSVMERICELRRKDGYPALAIQWGMIGDVGFVAESASNIVIDGLLRQEISSCLNVLDTLLTQNEVIVSSTLIDSKRTKYRSKSQDFLDIVAEILAITNLKHVSMHSTLPSLGLDSTSTVQLRQFLGSECNLYLTPRELRNMTLHSLMNKINVTVNC